MQRVQLYGGPQDGLAVNVPHPLPRAIRCHVKRPAGLPPCGAVECVYRWVRGRYTFSA